MRINRDSRGSVDGRCLGRAVQLPALLRVFLRVVAFPPIISGDKRLFAQGLRFLVSLRFLLSERFLPQLGYIGYELFRRQTCRDRSAVSVSSLRGERARNRCGW